MLRMRRAAQVLVLTVVTWLAGTAIVLAWIAGQYLPDPSSHQAQDALLLLVIFSPQVLVAALGLAVLGALRRDASSAVRPGLAWGALESLLGLLASWRLLGLLASVVTEGRSVSWDASESALVFSYAYGADYAHWMDLAALAMLIVAIVGLLAVTRLATTPASPAGRSHSGVGHPVGA